MGMLRELVLLLLTLRRVMKVVCTLPGKKRRGVRVRKGMNDPCALLLPPSREGREMFQPKGTERGEGEVARPITRVKTLGWLVVG